MRLLECKRDGSYKLTKEFSEAMLPKYAILSHNWLDNNEEEVTFKDMTSGNAERKKGYNKIRFCGKRAREDGLDYFWVDTCCINREASAELQEAITSMFSWYRKSVKCYVYLIDVSTVDLPLLGAKSQDSSDAWELSFRRSKWFKRGWTLQELLAPRVVEFYSAEHVYLGDKVSLESKITEITRIPAEALRGHDLNEFTIEARLSWSRGRETKRKEDEAYCLLGIFHLFIPLIYGEGENALRRLHNEIRKEHAADAALDQNLSRLPVASEAAFNSLNNQYEATCLPQTRSDLLQKIVAWADSTEETYVFWLNGVAGTGKSTVARTIARKYHQRGSLGASFFFSRGGGDLSNASRFVSTLARQLATKVPSVRRSICEAIRDRTDVLDLSILDQWMQLILIPLSKLVRDPVKIQTVVLVIDALDECGSESDIRLILRALSTASSLKNIHLRIFITSRPEIPIRHSFGKIPETERSIIVLHDIAMEVVKRDLNLFFQKHFSDIRDERDFEPSDWPGQTIIDRLVEISHGLFIWASIACRFIRDGRQLAMRRIRTLIDGRPTAGGPEKQLDQIYTTVLRNAIHHGYNDEEKVALYASLKDVLQVLVILSSPLSTNSLANLLQRQPSEIRRRLGDLHTIFQISDNNDHPIRLHHPTFRDFLLDRERCTDRDFWVDQKAAHRCLADFCLKIMTRMLRQDICGLGHPGTMICELDSKRIKQNIPPELEYACVCWVQHYRRSEIQFCDGDQVYHFLREHFLHWLEVMNLLAKSVQASALIRLYHALLNPAINSHQIPFIKDARRFMFTFQSIIKDAPLQTYCAGLAFVSSSNELRQHFRKQVHPEIHNVQVAEAILPSAKDEFNYVNDLVFSPDSTYIASGSQIMAARLWNSRTGAAESLYVGPKDKVSSVAISPDGKLLAGGSDDFNVWIWDLDTRANRFHLRNAHAGWVNSVMFSPDGTWLASGSMDETIAIWDVATGQQIKRFENQSSCVNCTAFSPDGKSIATGSVDQMIRLWDVSKTQKDLCIMFDGHFGPVNSIKFSPHGQQLVSGADDMTIKLWDIHKGKDTMTMEGHTKKVMTVTFSPDSRLIVSGSEDRTIKVWDTKTGAQLRTLLDHVSGLNSVAFSPDGLSLASCSFDDEVLLWDPATWTMLRKLDDFEDYAKYTVPISPNMQRRQLGSMDELMGTSSDNLLDVAIIEPKAHSSQVTSVVFSPDGRVVASSSQDATIKLWSNVGNLRFMLEGHMDKITCLAFSPDGTLLASGSADTIVNLWNTSNGLLHARLRGHSANVESIQFSQDSQRLFSRSQDDTVRLWSTSSDKQLASFGHRRQKINCAAFSADSKFLATCSSMKIITIWELASIKSIAIFDVHASFVSSVQFSTDGRLLLTYSEPPADMGNAIIKLWTRSGENIGTIIAGKLRLSSVALSPDNKRVASCSIHEDIVRIWNTETKLQQGILEPGVVITRVSFSTCGNYLHTDRGTLSIGPHSLSSTSHPQTRAHALLVTQKWITKDLKKIIWLPEEFYPTDVTLWGQTIVLGNSSGAVSFITIQHDQRSKAESSIKDT